MSKKKKIVIVAVCAFILGALYYFEPWVGRADNWPQPRFVKEWDVKEIKPGVPTQVISLTTNKHGVFALVKGEEVRYQKPKGVKRAAQMTEKEKKGFVDRYIMGDDAIFSYSMWADMTEKDRDGVIDFVRDYSLTHRMAKDMSKKEKESIIKKMTYYYDNYDPPYQGTKVKGLTERTIKSYGGEDAYIDNMLDGIRRGSGYTLTYYRIQRYDFDGNFVAQWPEGDKLALSDYARNAVKVIKAKKYDEAKQDVVELDSREVLVKPSILAADGSDFTYLADYDGNKVVKFNPEGVVEDVWIIDRKNAFHFYNTLGAFSGLAAAGGAFYVMSEGFDNGIGFVPRLSLFDAKGTVVKAANLHVLKVPALYPFMKQAAKIPFKTVEGKVNDMTVDGTGNIHMLAGDYGLSSKVFVIDKDFNDVLSFEPVLKKGFDVGAEVYDHEAKKRVRYNEAAFLGFSGWTFNSRKGANPFTGLVLYALDDIYASDAGEIIITFKGQKPFGAINAVIYDAKGRMKGYWKVEDKSNSEWFKRLNDVERIKANETDLSLALHGEKMFLAKAIEYYQGDSLKFKKGGRVVRSIIQRFDRQEDKK